MRDFWYDVGKSLGERPPWKAREELVAKEAGRAAAWLAFKEGFLAARGEADPVDTLEEAKIEFAVLWGRNAPQ